MFCRSILSAAASALLTLAVLPDCLRAEIKPEDLYSAVLPSIATLEVENAAGRRFLGSGFLAVGDRLVVTAWHVVHDARTVVARFSDRQRVKVIGVVDKDEKLDLALLALEGEPRPRLKLGAGAPRIGSRIFIMGSPRGLDFSIGEGLLSQVRTIDGVPLYQISCPISPGDSGSPVLNERGEVLGVVSWRKADAENVGFAIPHDELRRLDASRAPTAWPDPGPAAPGLANRDEREPVNRTEARAATDPAPDPFREFQRFLSRRAGQRLTVTVRERGISSEFTFEVPKDLPQ